MFEGKRLPNGQGVMLVSDLPNPKTSLAELVKRIAIPVLWRIPILVDSKFDEKLVLKQIEFQKSEKNTYANRKYYPKKEFWIKRDS